MITIVTIKTKNNNLKNNYPPSIFFQPCQKLIDLLLRILKNWYDLFLPFFMEVECHWKINDNKSGNYWAVITWQAPLQTLYPN